MRTTYAVNDMTIHRIVEQEHGFTPMLVFLPNLTKERQEFEHRGEAVLLLDDTVDRHVLDGVGRAHRAGSLV